MGGRLPSLLAATILLAACSTSRAPPRTVPEPELLTPSQREAYLEGLARAAAGDSKGADASLAPLLALRPLHVSSHLLHQDLARAEGRLAGERERYGRLAEEAPGDAARAVLDARLAGGTLEERVLRYQAAGVRDPASPWPRIALTLARTTEARALLRRADARAMEGFAEDSRRFREEASAALDRARTEGERAVAIAPGLAAAHGALGHALSSAMPGDHAPARETRAVDSRAMESLDRALGIDPGDPRILLDRALLRIRLNRRADAQADLDAAALAAPADALLLATRARNLEDLGRTEEARRAWDDALEAAPDWPEAWLDAGTARARAGLWSDALERYRHAETLYVRAGGDRWKARRGVATALAQLGLDASDPALQAEALEVLRAYRREGGPDRGWADHLGELLGEEPPPEAEAGKEGVPAPAPPAGPDRK